jgi:hypothetical protein
MHEIKTVFKVGELTYSVEGCGQSTVSAIIQKFPLDKVLLVGFFVNEDYVKANLESSFRYS